MGKSKYTLDLAQIISIRSVDFYLNVHSAMSAVDMREVSVPKEIDIIRGKFKHLLTEDFSENPQVLIEMMINSFQNINGVDTSTAMRIFGKLMLLHLRHGKFNENSGPISKLSFGFLAFAVVEELKSHGHGTDYYFVERFLDELAGRETIKGNYYGSDLHSVASRYTRENLAAIFLGYSLLSRGGLRPIAPFPNRPSGFVTVLMSDLKKLLPRNDEAACFFK